MSKVYASSVVDAPAERVWAAIRDFGKLADWHPAFTESPVEGGGKGNEVGAIRRLVLADGGVIRERLLGLSDFKRTCVYAILESPLGVENYVGTLRVTPVTDGNRSFVEWWSTFDCPPEKAQELTALIASVYQGGFDSLKAKLAG